MFLAPEEVGGLGIRVFSSSFPCLDGDLTEESCFLRAVDEVVLGLVSSANVLLEGYFAI